MARTISSSYSSGITLSSGDNPVSITSAGTINDATENASGLYGQTGTAWLVTNSGLISEAGAYGVGVYLASAGTVINTDLAVITAAGTGVALAVGGSVTNQSGGTISGYVGVFSPNDPATVVNAGAIYGDQTAAGAEGVFLGDGGSVTNQAGGTISAYLFGVRIVGGNGTVDNLGLIQSSDNVAAAPTRIGVYLNDGGAVINGASGGTVSTAYILGYSFGVGFGAGGAGTLTNYGTVSGGPGTPAVSLATGTIINGPVGATGALLQGGDQNSSVLITGAGTVVNYGSIIGVAQTGETGVFYGVSLGGAGSISNLGASSLIENYVGIYAAMNDTVTNGGTIEAMIGPVAASEAIVFGGGTNRLIVDPGAVFIGGISGDGAVTLAPSGNTTVIGTSHGAGTTTMELASGASAGMISGLGSTITNFASLTFDSGAQWTVTGNDSASGLGTLGIGGFTFGDTIDLTGFVAVSRTFASNSLVLTDGGGAHATLAIQGAFSTGDFQISSDGTGGTDINQEANLAYGQTIDATGIVATSETVTAGVLTLLAAGSPVGTINVGTSLSTGDFTLASDGSGGTDVIVSTIFGTYGAGVTLVVPVTTISATGTVNFSGSDGSVAISGPSGTAWNLTNNGTVADTGPDSYGVGFAGGGTVTNTATISGAGEGVYIGNAGGTGLVVNQGSIAGTSEFGVYLVSGGQVTNTAGATISGLQDAVRISGTGAVVSNLGGIAGGTNSSNNYGVYLRDGGLVTNGQSGTTASTASIMGYYGLVFKASGTATGTLINFGTVLGEGVSDGAGVKLTHAGTITNGPSGATAALIQGSRFGVTAAQAIVVNYATIDETGTSPGYDGIYIQNAGTVSNLGTASVIEGYRGVLLQTDGTLTNAGTIESNQGSVGTAVEFDGGNARLIADPGAVFIGSIFGGSGTAIVELASAATAGTLSGFGSTITNFTSLTFDPGARWTVTGNDSASGLGTLGIGGFAFGDTIDLTGFVAVSKTFASNSLVLTDGGGAHETLAIQGTFSTGDFQISNDGAGGTDINQQVDLAYGQTIDATGIVATSETVTAGVLTLLSAGSLVGTINVGTSLSTGDFTLASDGSGGTDVIVSTIFGTYGAGVTLVVPVTTISATGVVNYSGSDGSVAISGPGGTTWNLTNNGTVVDTGPDTYGVSFAGGGTVTNTATISGAGEGVYIGNGGGTGLVVNQGSIAGVSEFGVYLVSGGQVTNTASATISGQDAGVRVRDIGAVVGNLGGIFAASSGSHDYGVYLRDGGLVTNGQSGTTTSTASIMGYSGLVLKSLDVGNATGTLINFGTVLGDGSQGAGVLLGHSGTVTNGPSGATGALIQGDRFGVTAAQAIVVNYATIEETGTSPGYDGIYIQTAGTVSNLGTASAIEGYFGVLLGTDGTLTNAGTIESNQGSVGIAVQFDGGNARLIADPGAVFTGSVYGGNGGTAVMELASAASAGTLSGFGTTITNFTSLTFDPGAQWTVTGNDLASGLGTLGIGGFTFGDTIDLTGFVAVSKTFASNALVLTDGGGAHATLAIQGAFSTGDFQISSDGAGGTDINQQVVLTYGQTIDATGIVATSETVTAGVLTLLAAGSPVGTITVGTSLSTGDFMLKSDGSGGTDVVVSTVFGTYGAGVTLVVPVTTISGTGRVSFTGANGIASINGPIGTAWDLTNNGTVVNGGSLGYGVWLEAGGTITNTALITGGIGAMISGGTGVIVNQGSIIGSRQGIYLFSAGQVTNAAGATIDAWYEAVRISGTAATVSNLGEIAATVNMPGGYGIYMRDGGLVTNGQSGAGTSTASIQGYYGLSFKTVDVVNASGTLINFGTVISEGSEAAGVQLSATGMVTNGPSGATAALIQGGRYGVSAAQGQVVNYATIEATGVSGGDVGVSIGDAGTLSNLGTASLIEGYYGVLLETDGTLTNAGTIASNQGSVGVAVRFNDGSARLIADPGAVFTGSVFGGTGGTAVMELASAASAGVLSGFGTTITNFTSVVFDSGAQWTIGGNDFATGLGTLEITGFTANDTIDLTGFVAVSDTFASDVLVLTNGGGAHATLHVDGVFTSGDFQIPGDGGSGTDIIVCYAKGTRIATPAGERPIEDLEAGDLVESYFGGPVPVRWVGRRHVDCTRYPDPRGAWPVRVAAGSFGPAGPHRDLFLSPSHAVCVLGDLIPIKFLINGTSIVQVPVDEVTYYHIELAEHDMLWAEGLQAESYLDVGDRANFANGGGAVRLFPDFTANNAMLWETMGCAPLVVHGVRLEAARAWVNELVGRGVRAEVMAA